MIAVCDNHGQWAMGVRYDPALGPREIYRCPNCGGRLRAKRPGESVPNIVTADRARPPKAAPR